MKQLQVKYIGTSRPHNRGGGRDCMKTYGGAAEAIEWFVKNVIGKAAELFLDLVFIINNALSVISEFTEIGFWPSLILTSIIFVFWSGLFLCVLFHSRSLRDQDWKKSLRTYLLSMVIAIGFLGFCLRSIYYNTPLHAGRSYIFLAALYFLTGLVWISFLVSWLKDFFAKRSKQV